MTYSIVVPTYRGSKTLEKLFQKIQNVFNDLNSTFEVIFVFDGGNDDSWTIIKKLAIENPRVVKGIKLTRNFGQHNATICGFKYAKGEFIITMDEDLQHEPKDIEILIAHQRKNDSDVTYGSFSDRRHSVFRNLTSRCLNQMLSIGMPELNKGYSSFRMIKSAIAIEVLNMNNSYTFLDGYLTWITQNVSSVGVPHRQSDLDKSSYTLRKLIEHSINIFVTFSNLPMRLIIWLSAVLVIFSSLYGSYILIRKLIYDDFISGFATFAVLGSFGLATILFSLGVIGEYIYRINMKTTRRPVFKESEII